jgi:hypothetical protein
MNEHVILLPGARVTSHMVIRGPLKCVLLFLLLSLPLQHLTLPLRYGPIDISAEGGIHPSGSVFSQDGSQRERGMYYREECIEALLAKAAQSK